MENQIRVGVRALIIRGGKILLCQAKDADCYFLPGGGIHFEEGVEDALRRELKEELDVALEEAQFIGVVDNTFLDNVRKNREISIVFSVRIGDMPIYSREPHILFAYKEIKTFGDENVVPMELKKAVLQWIRDKTPFWVSMNKTTIS